MRRRVLLVFEDIAWLGGANGIGVGLVIDYVGFGGEDVRGRGSRRGRIGRESAILHSYYYDI